MNIYVIQYLFYLDCMLLDSAERFVMILIDEGIALLERSEFKKQVPQYKVIAIKKEHYTID